MRQYTDVAQENIPLKTLQFCSRVHTKLKCVINADTCMPVTLWWARCVNEGFSVPQYQLLITLQTYNEKQMQWQQLIPKHVLLQCCGDNRLVTALSDSNPSFGAPAEQYQLLQLCYRSTTAYWVSCSPMQLSCLLFTRGKAYGWERFPSNSLPEFNKLKVKRTDFQSCASIHFLFLEVGCKSACSFPGCF